MAIMDRFGETIRIHRKKCGLSQLQLANLAGIGKTTVFDIEKNKHTFQSDTIEKICDALNLELTVKSPISK